jgi:hypothetical protein
MAHRNAIGDIGELQGKRRELIALARHGT